MEGIDAIRAMLEGTRLNADDEMSVDRSDAPYVSPTSLAKKKALARFVRL